MKFILTVILVYLAYKVMFKPEKITPPSHNEIIEIESKDESEFVDYEEVDDNL